MIQRLMRRHQVTIRDLAKRMNITLKRVREVRTHGVKGDCMCMDWTEAICQPPSTSQSHMQKHMSGYLQLPGWDRIQIDFAVDAKKTDTQELDAACMRALAQKATITYTQVPPRPESGFRVGTISHEGMTKTLDFYAPPGATDDAIHAAFATALAMIGQLDYLELGMGGHKADQSWATWS